ncbi:ESX secretion-associated protein EspG [Saccharopolyspora erythraea]|uniref:ESX secretion-associated protein EspG n=1 Tax=Saccharopolyspora erythraea TaxID=1836 RepID=UPI001BAA1B80|nr:ESX secretion-associated protein EspG [Saccharopolyspora erythraea]QUG99707.1 ESX secretion-associated protein EspG [Saccharopolyspora erythraea]
MSERWRLPPLWFELCWEIGGFGDCPVPIGGRTGEWTPQERVVLRQRALTGMRAAGLLSGEALAPALAQALTQIARPCLWIDGAWMAVAGRPPARLLSVAAGSGSVLMVSGGADAEEVDISVHPRTSISAAATMGIPPVPPGLREFVSVPASAFGPWEEEAEGAGGVGGGPGDGGLGSEPTLAEMIDAPHFRDGQFTANLRARSGRKHRSQPLNWFDAFQPDGRYRLRHGPGGRNELGLTPLSPADITHALDRRIAAVVRVGG